MPGRLEAEPLEPLIFRIRGHRVVLDADLARLYGVHTKRFNQYRPWVFTEHGALMAASILRSDRIGFHTDED